MQRKQMVFEGKVDVQAKRNGVILELKKKGKLKLRLQAEGNIVSAWFGDKDATAWDFVVRQSSFVPKIYKLRPTHFLVRSNALCPACRRAYYAEDEIVLVPIQAHGVEGVHDRTVQTVAVHAKCYWPGERK